MLHRAGKEGLGRAYVAGFQHALAHGAERVMEMDADFSHDPRDIPRLVHEARHGADLVLGSRYVPGGGVENWGARPARSCRAAAACTRRRSCACRCAT